MNQRSLFGWFVAVLSSLYKKYDLRCDEEGIQVFDPGGSYKVQALPSPTHPVAPLVIHCTGSGIGWRVEQRLRYPSIHTNLSILSPGQVNLGRTFASPLRLRTVLCAVVLWRHSS